MVMKKVVCSSCTFLRHNSKECSASMSRLLKGAPPNSSSRLRRLLLTSNFTPGAGFIVTRLQGCRCLVREIVGIEVLMVKKLRLSVPVVSAVLVVLVFWNIDFWRDCRTLAQFKVVVADEHLFEYSSWTFSAIFWRLTWLLRHLSS